MLHLPSLLYTERFAPILSIGVRTRHFPTHLLFAAAVMCRLGRVRRDLVNTAASLIVVWLCELASHWELQPDKHEIHMSFPDIKVTNLTVVAVVILLFLLLRRGRRCV